MRNHVGTIDRNVEMANVWLAEISDQLDHVDREAAWAAMNAVLRTVRDRVPVDEAADFAAQLPTLIRGAYYEGWRPSEAPHRWRHKQDYLGAIREKLPGRDNLDPEQAARAVLKVAARHMNPEELEKIKAIHPKEVWDLWPTMH
ncbi:DUF2267 domain-containing protein [Gilvimarinus sp. F26214L]|uniref:DUF2267 domain-containing protein n=1 Tax=Gilvimarinus sp. DZF01 TaxID=3461371 RepID=UPI0040459824